jgi:hypothetical protein
MTGRLELVLDVPDLGRAVGFYSTLWNSTPAASERGMAWFDVPESQLRLELRETATPTPVRLRLCAESRQLRALCARLGRAGVRTIQAGLSGSGGPRAVGFSDPGGNRWELCTPIRPVSAVETARVRAGHLQRSVATRVRWLLSPGPVETRFQQQRTRDESLTRRHG